MFHPRMHASAAASWIDPLRSCGISFTTRAAPLAMQLFVLTLTGKTVTLNVSPDDVVANCLENISRVEDRIPAEDGSIGNLMHGTTHGYDPLRLAGRASGLSVDGSQTIRDLLSAHGMDEPLWCAGDMEVKVCVVKRMDNLNAVDMYRNDNDETPAYACTPPGSLPGGARTRRRRCTS